MVEQDAYREGCTTYLEFFRSWHGKGEHDGVGACVKRDLVKEKMNIRGGATFNDAHSIVDWCTYALSQEGTLDSQVSRFFWLVDEGIVGDKMECQTIRDYSKTHLVRSSDVSAWTIWKQEMACFCQNCI